MADDEDDRAVLGEPYDDAYEDDHLIDSDGREDEQADDLTKGDYGDEPGEDGDEGAPTDYLEEGAEGGAGADGKFKPSFSKYDFVKVRVWLSDEHYYVLSRFLVSRVLTSIKVKYTDSIRIALELKKTLVDQNILEVKQEQLEQVLFELMQKYDYGETTISLYKMMSRFHHHRIPLIILIGGTACSGKSALATQLAERLNMPSVLQTDITFELMRNLYWKEKENSGPVICRVDLSESELLERYSEEARLVRQGLEAEFRKCIEEGKSIIVEGLHIHLPLYSDLAERAALRVPRGLGHAPTVAGIVVAFLIVVEDEEGHTSMIEDWVSHQDELTVQQLGHDPAPAMLETARALQDFLIAGVEDEQRQYAKNGRRRRSAPRPPVHLANGCGFPCTVIPLSVTSFKSTLDTMHMAVLEQMKRQVTPSESAE